MTKTMNYNAVCKRCGKEHVVAGNDRPHFIRAVLPELKQCCGEFLKFNEVVK